MLQLPQQRQWRRPRCAKSRRCIGVSHHRRPAGARRSYLRSKSPCERVQRQRQPPPMQLVLLARLVRPLLPAPPPPPLPPPLPLRLRPQRDNLAVVGCTMHHPSIGLHVLAMAAAASRRGCGRCPLGRRARPLGGARGRAPIRMQPRRTMMGALPTGSALGTGCWTKCRAETRRAGSHTGHRHASATAARRRRAGLTLHPLLLLLLLLLLLPPALPRRRRPADRPMPMPPACPAPLCSSRPLATPRARHVSPRAFCSPRRRASALAKKRART